MKMTVVNSDSKGLKIIDLPSKKNTEIYAHTLTMWACPRLTRNQWRLNVGPASQTVGQHETIGSMSHVVLGSTADEREWANVF